MKLRYCILVPLLITNMVILCIVPMQQPKPSTPVGQTTGIETPISQPSGNSQTGDTVGPTIRFRVAPHGSTPAATPQTQPLPEATTTSQPRPSVIYENGRSYPNLTYKMLLSPNDPNATQWWTTNTGLNTAWNSGTGTNGPLVAIIDSGFALSHEEFTGRWYTNPNETINGMDDDGNGYVDDTSGWDFVNNDRLPQAGQVNPSGSGVMHGTMVAGIIAATGNNGKGIAGISWGARILPIQVLSDDGAGDTYGVARGVRYAADQGAKVINLSLGSVTEDTYLRDAIQYAIDRGAVVVAAAGNDGCDCMLYPARYPEVVAVGASASDGNRASFSSYGANLDIVAPGNLLYTTSWQASAPTNAYTYASGTSLASPYISGLLALGRSFQPNATWGELLANLLQKADHRSLTAVSPRANDIGFGYVKADGFISRLVTPAVPLQRTSFSQLYSSDVLSSSRLYQCDSGEFPSAPLYELSLNGQVRYTSSDLERYRAINSGWVVTNRGYVCDGLPTDVPSTIRVINMLQEILNRTK